MRRLTVHVAVCLVLFLLGAPALAAWTPQTPQGERQLVPPQAALDPGPFFRVFLTDGRALVSYGESALVGDRVVFTLVIGDGGPSTTYQLMSLPKTAIDLDRTDRYRDAVRGARYAATRGEADYVAMTDEVSRTLDAIKAMPDPQQRLISAEEARRRLLQWSKDNYHYRAKDVDELVGLFDDVIASLKVAAGASRLSLDMVAGTPAPRPEPIRTQPTLRESIEMALAAVNASDVGADRVAILNAATAASAAPGMGDLQDVVTKRFDDEHAADKAYDDLRADVMPRAQGAAERGDVDAVTAARNDVVQREQQFAVHKPDSLRALLAELDTLLARTTERKNAIDRYVQMRPQLLAYERSVRSAFVSMDGITPVLRKIQDMKSVSVNSIVTAEATLRKVGPSLQTTPVPDEVADVQSTLVSALNLAVQACARRRMAIATNDSAGVSQASASAAGALLLVANAHESLVSRLYPPGRAPAPAPARTAGRR